MFPYQDMRPRLALLMLLMLLLGCGQEAEQKTETDLPSEPEVVERVASLSRLQQYDEALKTIDEALLRLGPSTRLIYRKYQIQMEMERFEDALETFEKVLLEAGDSPDVVIDKVRLLTKLGRYDEALRVALATDEKSTEKSAYLSSAICKVYVRLSDREKALEWLSYSFDRGDNGFEYYLQDEFQLLHSDPKFAEFILKMRERTGIGLPARDFTVALISGGSYSLSQDRGKVVLIDFWATWCSPCVAEFPRLKEIYAELRDRGFEIIGVSLDSEKKTLEGFLEEAEVPWRIGFSGKGMEDEVAQLYKVDSAPRYWVIDREGIVRHSLESGGEKLERAVREIIGE